LASKIEYINIKIIKKNKHFYNPWINHFVNKYCTKFPTFGEYDCFSLDFNTIQWSNEFYVWMNKNNKKNELINNKIKQ
jgi:hypothetical protein